MIRVVVARGCAPTGALLLKLLKDRGLDVDSGGKIEGIVSYGVRLQQGEIPILNSNAGGGDKLAELQALARGGVLVPSLWTANQYADVEFPALARRRFHTRGTDIRVIRSLQAARRWARDRDFFTKLIPQQEEFRVQVYRSSHLGTYQKVLQHPNMKKSVVARNLRNGYVFQLCHEDQIPRDAVDVAMRAIKALGLDFGGVDVLQGRDGKFYVLEVNTACGAEDGRQWFNSLTDKIAAWSKKGFPKRKEQ